MATPAIPKPRKVRTMKIERVWARAAVNVALHPGLNHLQVSRNLIRAAQLDPSALKEKIKTLRKQIDLLETYLPKGENDDA